MPTSSSDHLEYRIEDYHVAIICALPIEYDAVRNMFDGPEHGRPSVRDDSNRYALGVLQGHNVVLASRAGNQGKGAAATIATNLARSFPYIKHNFLVGIAGGVPSSENDIRLGDVVISMPDNQHAGVVQYDLGKETRHKFKMKGYLTPPSTEIINAVQNMASDHIRGNNEIQLHIDTMLQQWPGTGDYARPDSLDLLFEADYVHQSESSPCQDDCHGSRVIKREDRSVSAIELHYGLIASGDRVIKCGKKRDKLAKKIDGVLCFEMEAAGIATGFPCLTIRGISDYADSHKNDAWQKYAAATATGALKELLKYVGRNKDAQNCHNEQMSSYAGPSANRHRAIQAPSISYGETTYHDGHPANNGARHYLEQPQERGNPFVPIPSETCPGCQGAGVDSHGNYYVGISGREICSEALQQLDVPYERMLGHFHAYPKSPLDKDQMKWLKETSSQIRRQRQRR